MQTISPTGSDSTVVVQNALAAAAGTGGTIFFTAGNYVITQPLLLPGGVHLIGEGNASNISFPNDFGSGVSAIGYDSGAPNYASGSSLTRLAITGPGSSHIMGQSPAHCDGWECSDSSDASEVTIQGFRAGIVIRRSHNTFYRVHSNNNFYNVYFADKPYGNGNHQFIGCWLDGPTMASVCVSGDNIISGGQFLGGHVGFGPYAFLAVDPPTGPVQGVAGGFLHSVSILNVSFEQIGNGAIVDKTTGSDVDSMMGVDIRDPGFIWDTGGGYRIPNVPADWCVDVRRVTSTRYFAGQYPFTSGSIGVFNASLYADWDLDVGTFGPQANLFGGGDGTTWCAACGDAIVRDGNKWIGRPRRNASGAAIAQGELTEYGISFYEVRPYGEQGRELSGIALAEVPGGAWFVVGYSGIVNALCEPGAANGSPLYILPGSTHLTPSVSGSPVATSEAYGSSDPGAQLLPVRIHYP